MRRLFGLASLMFAATMIAGCDGAYTYRYDGRLVGADARTPLVGARAAAFAEPVDCSSEGRYSIFQLPVQKAYVTVDQEGQFSGSFIVGTGWVFLLRPPPPQLPAVYLCVQLAGTPQRIKVPLNHDSQAGVISGQRHLKLGTVVVPQAD